MSSKLLTNALILIFAMAFLLFGHLATPQAIALANRSIQQTSSVDSKPSRPNIVLILLDDLSIDPKTLQSMQKLQQLLVSQGASFTNAIVTVPSCCPSRASIFTGKYAHNHQVLSNSAVTGGFPAFYRGGQEAFTIGTSLKGVGYRTVLLGKYLNHYPLSAPPLYIPGGWSEWYAHTQGELFTNYALNENGVLVSYGAVASDYSTDVYTAHAVNFINHHTQTTPTTPFFLMLNPYAPHAPAQPAQRHANLFPNVKMPQVPSYNERDLSDKPRWVAKLPSLTAAEKQSIAQFYLQQLRSLQAVDEMIAAVVNTLITTRQINNTYIIFTSDNGLHHGEHRIVYGKGTAYEEAIRVPFIVRGPGIAPGTTYAEVITLADLAPTFADLAGAAWNERWDGRSVVPLLSSPSGTKPWRAAVFFTSPNAADPETANVVPAPNADPLPAERPAENDNDPAGLTPDQAVDEDGAIVAAARTGGMAYQGFRTKTYKYVEYKNGDKELYALVNDPYELTNLASRATPALLAALANRLAQFRNCAGNNCRVADSTAPTITFPLSAVESAATVAQAEPDAAVAPDEMRYWIYLPTISLAE